MVAFTAGRQGAVSDRSWGGESCHAVSQYDVQQPRMSQPPSQPAVFTPSCRQAAGAVIPCPRFTPRDLAPKDRNGASDPFVRVHYNGRTQETSVRTLEGLEGME